MIGNSSTNPQRPADHWPKTQGLSTGETSTHSSNSKGKVEKVNKKINEYAHEVLKGLNSDTLDYHSKSQLYDNYNASLVRHKIKNKGLFHQFFNFISGRKRELEKINKEINTKFYELKKPL